MRKKNGFTVIELIIVIGVIGILAGVLVPSFIGLNNKAKLSSDKALVKNLNSCLLLRSLEYDDTTNNCMHDAVEDLAKSGISVDQLTTKSNEKLLWNLAKNEFLLERDIVEGAYPDSNYWEVIDEYDADDQQYSLYASNKFNSDTIDNLTVGFDAGDNYSISSINYVNKDESEVIIRTNGNTAININAPKSVIKHMGEASSISIKEVADSSYHEYGSVNDIHLNKGRYILESSSSISNMHLNNKETIIGSVNKARLRNVIFHDTDYIDLEFVKNHNGEVLDRMIAYTDENGYIIFKNKITDEEIPIPSESEVTYREDEIQVKHLSDSEQLVRKFYKKNNVTLSLDSEFTLNNHVSKLTGTINLNFSKQEFISYKADLTLSAGFDDVNIDLTYIDKTYYLTIKNGHYIFSSSDINSLIDMINSFDDDFYIPNDIFGINMKKVVEAVDISDANVGDNYINYQTSLFNNTDINITSDIDHVINNIEITPNANYKNDFKIIIKPLWLAEKVEVTNPMFDNAYYFNMSNLSTNTRNGITKQMRDFINLKEAGITYSIDVRRDDNFTFNANGRLDLSLLDENHNEDIKVDLSGVLTNKNENNNLSSHFHVSYVNETAYFNYNDKLKLAYNKTNIEDFITIIKTRLLTNDTIANIFNKFLPDNSTSESPLFQSFDDKNYYRLLNYFNNIYKDSDGNIVISFDGSALSDNGGSLDFVIGLNDKINTVKVNNVYAYGYRLNCSFAFDEYKPFQVASPDSYTSLNYMNNILDTMMNIIDTKKHSLSLSGSISDNNGKISINGSTQFAFGDSSNYGVASLTIKDRNNRSHNLKIDITNQKVSENASKAEREAAIKNSQLYFVYNSALKGKMSLGSISDVIALIQELASNNDERFEKYKALLTADYSSSSILRILDGEIEALLYDNVLNNITYSNNTYTIDINNQLLKNNGASSGSIYLDLRLDNNHNFIGATLRGKILDYNVNLNLDVTAWSNSYSRLNKNDSYYDFSDLKTLAEYLFNTAKKNDYHVQGYLNIDLSFIKFIQPDVQDVPMEAFVHIEKDDNGEEKVYSRVEIDVPYYSSILQESKKWESRKFYIYFTDQEVYLRTKTYTGSDSKTLKEVRSEYVKTEKVLYYHNWYGRTTTWDEEYYSCQDVKLSMKEFFDNALYYVFNFGFDIDTDKVDMRDYAGSNSDVDYGKLLTSYKFNNGNTPSWNASINTEELTGSKIGVSYSDLGFTLYGNSSSKEMQSLSANLSINIIKIISFDFKLDATLDYAVIEENRLKDIKDYVTYNSSHTNKQIISSTYTVIRNRVIKESSVLNDKSILSDGSRPTKYIGFTKVSSFTTVSSNGSIVDVSIPGIYVTKY